MAKSHNLCLSWMGVMLNDVKDNSYPGWDSGCFRASDGRLDVDAWTEFCRMIANVGANQTRLFMARPWVEVSSNKWDLTRYVPEYWGDMRQMIAIAKAFNVRCIVTLFDECEFHLGRINPYSSNVQEIKFYRDLTLSKKIVKRFLNELGPTNCDWEICNEMAWTPGWESGKGNVAWFAALYELLLAEGVPAANIIYGPLLQPHQYNATSKQFEIDSTTYAVGQAAEIWRAHGIGNDSINASRMVVHNVGGAPETVSGIKFPNGYDTQFAVQFFGRQSSKPRHNPFVSDDGIGQNDMQFQPDGRWTRPTPKALGISSEHIFRNSDGNWTIEVLSYRDLIEAQGEAIAQAYKRVCGAFPHDYGKYPKPEPEPEPPTPPEPPKPTTCGVSKWYQHFKKTLNFRAAWDHLMGRHNV